jgi:uncharacterized ferritin-like protein (DUF455 family)
MRPLTTTVRHLALAVVRERDPDAKARAALALSRDGPFGEDEPIAEPPGLPGRPDRPQLVAPAALSQRSVATVEGRAALIHALAHIELNAIDLAADIVWRFAGLPAAFYAQWVVVAQEEARHFRLLRAHLQSLGHDYGDLPAHHGLWEMAEKTRLDLLARLALVPRTLEARGLDASPAIKARLVAAGDRRAGEILDVILRDEIGHVAVGNRWYRWLCERDGLDPLTHQAALAQRHHAPRPRPPFNREARAAAGFTSEEIAALGG